MKRLPKNNRHRRDHQQVVHQRVIDRYLTSYAEPVYKKMPCLRQLQDLKQDSYAHVLVIPAFDEPAGFLESLLPSSLQQTLVIVVINAAEDSDRAAIDRTQSLWQSFRILSDRSSPTSSPLAEPASTLPERYWLIAHNPTTTVLVVDCCTQDNQLPPNQGVGLARKIGGDIALAYMAQDIVASNWIHYTDADVVLPEDFFEMDWAVHLGEYSPSQNKENQSAISQAKIKQEDIAVILYPFQHKPPHRHILLYELSLRYYVTELAAARSPYAFHTIGSLMCVNGLHYAKVRGFPKRKAAEDFYMLNKLAKTGAVVQLQSPIVTLASRLSHRVPFGTGAMMTKLAGVDEFMFYHPAIFQHLREWMDCIEALWANPPQSAPPEANNAWIETWFSQSQWQGACWVDCLKAMGLEKTLAQAYRQSRDRHHFRLYMWTWFDAFRTLKFVHYLRDHHYPPLSVVEWIKLTCRSEKQDLGIVSTTNTTAIHEQQLEKINQYFCHLESTLTSILGPTISDS